MARSFSGTNVIVSANSFVFPGGSGPFTFATWLKITAGANSIRCITRSTGGSGVVGAYVNSTNFFSAFVDPAGTIEDSTFKPTLNVWCHVGWVDHGGNTAKTMYANGATAGNTAVETMGADSGVLNVGLDSFSQPLRGNLADFAFWAAALTTMEFAALFNGARPNQIRPTKLWYPLDGLQSPEPDLSGFRNNGTVTGAASVFGPPLMPFTPRWPQFLSPPPPPPLFTLMPQIVT